MNRPKTLLLALTTALLPACTGAQLAAEGPWRPAQALPPFVVAAGTAVVTLPERPDVRLATVRSRVPVQVQALDTRGNRVLARVAGGVEVAGRVEVKHLGVLVCAPGWLDEHHYAGAGNLLFLRAPLPGDSDLQPGEEGPLPVGGTVQARSRGHTEGLPVRKQFAWLPFDATIDRQRLCSHRPPPRHAGTQADPTVAHLPGEVDAEDFPPGTPFVDIPKDTTLTLLATPGGAPIFTRDAEPWGFTLIRLEHRDGWDRVAVGDGPYLVGWMPARPVREPSAIGGLGLLGGLSGGGLPGPWSLHTQALQRWPLHELPAGTEIQQFGVVRARLVRSGFARASVLRDGWQYVVAAVDDDVVVEGWIEPKRLGRLVQAATHP